MGTAAAFVRDYLERVVNSRDVDALDELVTSDWRGYGDGWPPDLEALRAFYRWQAEQRPDWHIDVQETVEVGDCVAVRAVAGPAQRHQLEWLCVFRLRDGRLAETHLMALRELPPEAGPYD